ncbi:Uncharacterized small protein (plasmid) [Legionella adelaidensis]|uniref:Uncharacterized small protein n=1 Tax=Legionella adelaidensis TaxID=45056 RepID=A0A0W0R3C4_9GAMM|nr:UPF0175 family protein [Legionella adelaidensis]KTC65532.1 hypothetical protein Lade_0190 [Legionella adelaidensis]VEH84647.1 Uncharacterized small protein [Legionella adelaidensis]
MDTFTVRDLRERTGTLISDAEQGQVSLVTKFGRPVFLAVPFSEELINLGLRTSLAIKLFKDEILTLEKAAKVAELSVESFIDKLGQLGISVVNYSEEDLEQELKDFE